MVKSMVGRLGIVALGTMLVAGCASKPAEPQKDSGFLSDYSRLKAAPTPVGGTTVRQWLSPKATKDNYHALLIEPIVFHPEPQPSEQVSAETLQQILSYFNNTLRQSLSKRFQVVDKAGPGVLRMRLAFSSVGAQGEGLQPFQYIPLAFVATMAARAATGEPQRAFVVLEVEGTDSVTGELLAMRTRVGTGAGLANVGGKRVVTLEDLKPLIDELTAAAGPDLDKYVKGR